MHAVVRPLLTLTLATALASQMAMAHSMKQGTRPAEGAVLTVAPAAIAMTFDMPMRVTMISLTDQAGEAYPLTRSDDMQAVTEFSAEPPSLPIGTYTVDWRGLAEDGHPMQGSFSFEVTE